jgi:hypothetical protein
MERRSVPVSAGDAMYRRAFQEAIGTMARQHTALPPNESASHGWTD